MNKQYNDKGVWTGVQCKSKKTGSFIVPVLRGEAARTHERQSNQSKYLRPTFAQRGGSYQGRQHRGFNY